MSRDRREDPGQYYPGGSVIPKTPTPSGGVGGDGDVRHVDFADIDIKEDMSLKEVGSMVNTLVRKLKGPALLLLSACCFSSLAAITPDTDFGDISPTNKLGEIVAAAGAVMATKEYVDRQDAATLQAAKDDILATNKEVDKAKSSANEAKATANEAKTYSVATYNFMNGNTNAWFAGTNYVFEADATNKHHFAFEDGMDLGSVPCSMALWENRDGARQLVWDQRDWTSWYWSFKARQMRQEIAATNAEIYAEMTNYAPRAWSRMTAASGLENPDRSTTWIDTKNVTLSPGMAWETVATVGGCGYWTIVGNGAVIGGSGTNATLNIKDFEGNSILEITKGQHMLAWLESSDFVGQMYDTERWVCFDMMADVKPTGYFSTTLVAADFVAETDENCPAQYRWEDLGGHVWRIHFLLKPGIVSAACFAKFLVEVEGKTQIRYNADTVINGGLIFDGVKIAPVIQSGAAVGSTVTWKVVQ